MTFKTIKQNWVLWLGLLAGLFCFTFHITGFDLAFIPGDAIDTRFNIYILEHGYSYLSGRLDSYWSAPFMYPEPNVIAYSDNLLGTLPLYAIFRAGGLDVFRSFQLWFVLMCILNYLCAYYFFRVAFKDKFAAVLGAFVFAFSLSLFSQITHAQLFPRFPIPLAFLFAFQFGKSAKPGFLGLTLITVVYQFYCGVYLGFFLAISIGIYLVSFVFSKDFRKSIALRSNWWLKVAGYSMVCGTLLLILLMPYYQDKKEFSPEAYLDIFHTIPSLDSYTYAFPGSLLWSSLNNRPEGSLFYWDHEIFPGIISIAAIILVWVWFPTRRFHPRLRLSIGSATGRFFATAAITIFLFMRFGDYSAFKVIHHLPGFSSLRSITRIINLNLVFLGGSVAFVFSLIKWPNRSVRVFSFILVFMILLADNFVLKEYIYKTNASALKDRSESLYRTLKNLPSGALVSYEPDTLIGPAQLYQLDAMLAGQKAELTLINAYTGSSPKDYFYYWNNPNSRNRNLWLKDKKLNYDSIYIVNEHGQIKHLSIAEEMENQNTTPSDREIRYLINSIRKDKKWLNTVKLKASEKGIPLDSMLYLDAKWVLENRD